MAGATEGASRTQLGLHVPSQPRGCARSDGIIGQRRRFIARPSARRNLESVMQSDFPPETAAPSCSRPLQMASDCRSSTSRIQHSRFRTIPRVLRRGAMLSWPLTAAVGPSAHHAWARRARTASYVASKAQRAFAHPTAQESHEAVARMERSEIRDGPLPHFASLHAGYEMSEG